MKDQGSSMNFDFDIGKVMISKIKLCQQQMNNKQLKSYRNYMSQKTITIDDQNSKDNIKLQQLLKENQSKQLALKKANNLIELLNIEVERNSHQENIKLAQQIIIAKFQRQNHQLKQKIGLLEREIKAKMHTNQNEKTIRKSVLTRANSSKSMQHVKKKAIHQKYTESFQEIPQIKQPINFEAQMYRRQTIELQEWRQEVIKLLNNLIKEEYDELQDTVNEMENMGEDCQKICNFKPKNRKKAYEDLSSIVQSQTGIINSLKAYCQQLQDICKNLISKLNSIFASTHAQIYPIVSIEQEMKTISMCITSKKEQWKVQRTNLQSENNELKYILDSMIKLVREEKKHK